MAEKKELKEEELKNISGGVEIVAKESENHDVERDLNRIGTICKRRDSNTTDNFNLLQILVDTNSEIKVSK